MNVMTKRGQMDNVITYEHICDFTSDLANINPQYITLGSVAIVLKGDAGLQMYMAASDKTWVSLLANNNNSDENDNNNSDSGT